MMQGYVNRNNEAILPIVVKNEAATKSIRAVIDTGFTGFLSLPYTIITELDLSWKYSDRGTLGDGSEVLFDVFEVSVIWDGQYQEIEVNAADTEPLLGMQMLRGYRLQMDIVEGGLVVVQRSQISID